MGKVRDCALTAFTKYFNAYWMHLKWLLHEYFLNSLSLKDLIFRKQKHDDDGDEDYTPNTTAVTSEIRRSQRQLGEAFLMRLSFLSFLVIHSQCYFKQWTEDDLCWRF
jgi:hypothetical protein